MPGNAVPTGSCRRLHACAIDQLPATAAAGPSNEATQRNTGCQLWGQEVKGQRSEIRSGVMQMKRRNEDGMRARRRVNGNLSPLAVCFSGTCFRFE